MALMLIVLLFVPLIPISNVFAQTETTITEHVRLGFTTSYSFSEGINDVIEDLVGWDLITYDFAINGEAELIVDMGVDIALTYDKADVLPGQPIEVQITYTPTDDPGPEVSLDASATLTADIDVTAAGYIELGALFPPLIGVLAALDSIDSELANFDLAVGSADFAAPLTGDSPVTVPMGSDTAVLSFAGLDIVGASLSSSLTLSPVPVGDFPDNPIGGGAGGAVAFVTVDGATLTNPGPILGVPGLPAILEWGTAGQTLTATIELPSSITGTGVVDAIMSPLLHWLGTSANINLNIDLRGVLDTVFGDRTVNLLSGSLGPVYQQIGLDTTIGDIIASTNPFGLDPGVGTLVGTGLIPVPLLDPEISEISLGSTPTLGELVFTIDLDSDDDGLMDGTEIELGTDPDDSDSDDDGLIDGDEINIYGTDPLDPDTDDDDLIDGDEISIGTDPLDPDTDDDGLLDGEEVHIYGTDPLDPDTDDDGLIDGIEILTEMDPLDPDSDDDGLLDGEDVEFIQNALNNLDPMAFKGIFNSKGNSQKDHLNAILKIFDDVERHLLKGKTEQAIQLLQNLRKHVDGDPNADNNDWIVDNQSREQIRSLIDLLLTNISS